MFFLLPRKNPDADLLEEPALINQKLLKQIHDIIPEKWSRKDLPLYIGQVDGVDVYIVDGDLVRNDYWMDFNYGGHSYIYGIDNTEYPNVSFIPPNQIWLESHIDPNELVLTLYHEINEYNLMQDGVSYEEAHAQANRAEQELMNHLHRYDFIKITKQKLTKVGLKIQFRLKYITGTRITETIEEQKLILFNFEDTYGTNLAIQGSVFLLLHEIGHLFYHLLPSAIKNGQKFKVLFGNPKKSYLEHAEDHPDYVSAYGRLQPLEEFAEIFALYVYYEGDYSKALLHLRTHHRSPSVFTQLRYIIELIKKFRNQIH